MIGAPVVLVTGAGGGLGRGICERFHSAGYVVVATDITAECVADFHDRPGISTATLDVTDMQSARDVAAMIAARYGRLDVLVNNAGVISYFPVTETDPEVLVRHFQINSFGALRVTHACLDLLVVSGGRVLNISSESYRLRTPFQIYQSTKLALEGISDVLRRELVHLGVHVASIRPGAINTALFHAMGNIANPVPGGRLAAPFARFAARLAAHAPSKRSEPDAVAALVFRAATDARKRAHYAMNNMFSLRLMSWLPVRWADWLIRKLLG